MDLLLSDATKRSLKALQDNPGGAYLFYGIKGSGKASAAKQLASQLANSESDIITLTCDGKSIGIEAVHNFNLSLSLKRITAVGHRVAVVDEADSLTREAQNALLKILEEPPVGTSIILISHSRQLLPTILSRCKSIGFANFDNSAIKKYLVSKMGVESSLAEQLCKNPITIGRAISLVSDQEGWVEYQSNLAEEQKLLSDNLFERLSSASRVIKNSNPEEILIGLAEEVKRELRAAASKQDVGKIKVWVRRLNLVVWCQKYIAANGNPKFAFDRLALEMSS